MAGEETAAVPDLEVEALSISSQVLNPPPTVVAEIVTAEASTCCKPTLETSLCTTHPLPSPSLSEGPLKVAATPVTGKGYITNPLFVAIIIHLLFLLPTHTPTLHKSYRRGMGTVPQRNSQNTTNRIKSKAPSPLYTNPRNGTHIQNYTKSGSSHAQRHKTLLT
ncbi:hypothetical protein [Candidatus Ichthyocystis sparus]|uniref:hypothetical protein n=1 Tax=Candidatus Ichthyocystis sparus TaxID=1561004 RepID=UPI00159EBA6E|nr:hypothetical protein [Candidatus Ichthyocystis sparus]